MENQWTQWPVLPRSSSKRNWTGSASASASISGRLATCCWVGGCCCEMPPFAGPSTSGMASVDSSAEKWPRVYAKASGLLQHVAGSHLTRSRRESEGRGLSFQQNIGRGEPIRRRSPRSQKRKVDALHAGLLHCQAAHTLDTANRIHENRAAEHVRLLSGRSPAESWRVGESVRDAESQSRVSSLPTPPPNPFFDIHQPGQRRGGQQAPVWEWRPAGSSPATPQPTASR